METVEYKSISFTVWDVGGSDSVRYIPNMWRYYFQNIRGIVYVIDSADEARLKYAKHQLSNILSEDELREAFLLVFANKQDLPEAKTTAEITDKLGLHALKDRSWYIQASSAITGDGLYEGLDWLNKKMTMVLIPHTYPLSTYPPTNCLHAQNLYHAPSHSINRSPSHPNPPHSTTPSFPLCRN